MDALICSQDVLAWVKKRRRTIRREDLISFLCGKAPPPRSSRTNPRLAVLAPSRASPSPETGSSVETDLQPFREAIALHGKRRPLTVVLPNLSGPYGSCCVTGLELPVFSSLTPPPRPLQASAEPWPVSACAPGPQAPPPTGAAAAAAAGPAEGRGRCVGGAGATASTTWT